MRIDLHTHSTRSDGTDTPADLVAKAALAVDVIALTDHDTVDGWRDAAAALPSGLTLVPGAEISCGADGRSLHMLAYLFDPAAPELTCELERLATDRVRRAHVMVTKLQELGVPISWDHVAGAAADGTIGRPHIASALVDLGVVPDVRSAFTPAWVGHGGRAYAEKYVLDPVVAVGLIRRAGGVAVLAHPLAEGHSLGDGLTEMTRRLVDAGLAGLEVDHPSHDVDDRRRLREIAAAFGLVATGSSDYHGRIKDTELGACTTEPSAFETILDLATGTSPVVG
ncbi:MAG: PHP domain-containing protein [Acidimicrobiales bacterium]